jgi:dipeptidyl aminopeptidase/acylaminoacyl peptidase
MERRDSGQESVAPNENLVLEGIRPISRAVAERVAPYTEFREAMLCDWHPTRREILISTRFADVPQLHRVAFPGGARTQLTFYPERVLQGWYRPRTADGFVFSKDVGGNEAFQFFWRDAATGRTALFTDGRSRNTGGRFSHSGHWFAYQSTRRNGRDTDLYLVDPADPAGERRLLEVEGGGWGACDWAHDDRTLLVAEYVSVNESRLYLVDVATGKTTLLTPPGGEKAWYGSHWGGDAAFSKDGRGVYLTTDVGSEFKRLAYLDLGTRAIEVLTPAIPWDVVELSLSADGARVAFVVNEGGSETLHLLDLTSRAERTLPTLPLGTIAGVRFHANCRDLGFVLSSAHASADVYTIDVATGELERWTESEIGGLDAATFSDPEPIRWSSFDGRTITGFLYRPPARFTGPRPVIINIHGGPESQFQPGFLGRNNFLLNELGVALLFPNVRGSSGFGKTFLTLDNAEKREDAVRDIGALLHWIGTQGDLDASRLMVMGGSYGGYMTLASMIHYNDRFRCALSRCGTSSFVTFLENTEAYRQDLRRAEYGDERDPAMRAFLTKIAPLTNASKITKPLFLAQGKNDPRVPYTEAEQMVAAIRGNGGPVWYLLALDEGHGFARKQNTDFLFLATVRFIEEYLLA